MTAALGELMRRGFYYDTSYAAARLDAFSLLQAYVAVMMWLTVICLRQIGTGYRLCIRLELYSDRIRSSCDSSRQPFETHKLLAIATQCIHRDR